VSRRTPEWHAAREAEVQRQHDRDEERLRERREVISLAILEAAAETGYSPSDKLVEFLSNLLERVT
jgi:hypothetical protein